MMDSGIDYKGLLFVYDEENLEIKVWQGETYKTSYDNFSGSDVVLKFLIWRNELYGLVDDGRLIKLIQMNSGTTDTWETQDTAPQSVADMVNYNDEIYIVGTSNMYKYSGSSITLVGALPASHNFYSAISVEDYMFLYGDDGTYTEVDRYNGLTFTGIFKDTVNGAKTDYTDIYTKEGKPHLEEHKGKLYFHYHYNATSVALIEYDIFTDLYREVTEIGTINAVATALKVDNGMLLIAVYVKLGAGDESNIYIHILDDYIQERELVASSGDNVGKLWRVESDPILPSVHDRERLIYYPSYSIVGNLGGVTKPLYKYGRRLECFTDLNNVVELVNKNLKETVDHICNALDTYLIVQPENVAEAGVKDLVGREDKFLTLSDDEGYGDLQFSEIKEYVQGENNFRRIAVGWSNLLIGQDVEIVGSPGILNVSEYSFESFLLNHPIIAQNVAEHLFGNMYSADGIVLVMEYAPFLRNNQNINFKTISSYLYLSDKKEYKIAKVEHKWNAKTTILTVVERNLVFKTLEI
jgi:hypothetical protein